jgi:hypothetical protein
MVFSVQTDPNPNLPNQLQDVFRLLAHKLLNIRSTTGPMSRLNEWIVDELYAVIYTMHVAQTVEPLDELSAMVREEMLEELKLRNVDESGIALFRVHLSLLPHRLPLIGLPQREERRMLAVPSDPVPNSALIPIHDLEPGD